MPYYLEKGSTLRVHSMVKRLLNEGYAVDIVCYSQGSDPDLPDLTVSRAGIRALTDTEAGPSLADLLNDVFVAAWTMWSVRSNDYDLLQGEDVEGFTIVLLASLFSDAETVYDLHNPLTENLRLNGFPVPTRLTRAIEGLLYRRADRVLANWGVWADAIRSRHGVDHIETVYDELPTGRRETDLPSDRYLVYVGNFKRYQGVDILIDAFERVVSATDVDLVLVGEPTDAIQRTVAESTATERIHLVGRHDVETTNYVLANAVAAVLPRRQGDQPGTKLLHYAMHELPIVATDLDCNRELNRFDNRVLLAAPTAEAIADCLLEVSRGA